MFRRRTSSRYNSWSSIDTMTSIPQSVTSSTRPRSRDTGFPEPFCGRGNTTLPHPDANLSPDACISSDDISISRVLSRQRRSFLSKNSWKQRTVSRGVITPEMEQMYSDTAIAESDAEPSSPTLTEPGLPTTQHYAPAAKGHPRDSGVSFDRPSTADEAAERPQTSAESPHHHGKGLFKKLGLYSMK